jgi:hypothetical protein
VPIVLAASGASLLVGAAVAGALVDPRVGVGLAVAALGDLGVAAWLAQRERGAADTPAAEAARRAAIDALPGEAASWMALGGLRRATLDLPAVARADVHAALDALESRAARGEDIRAVIAETQDAVDALRAAAVLRQRGAPDAVDLARRAAAVRAAAERSS